MVNEQSELESVALRLLNERRVVNMDTGKTQEFIERVTDTQDGDMAVALINRLYNVEYITPEVV